MQKIKVSKETYEKIQKMAIGLAGASLGMGIGSILAWRAEQRMKAEHEKLQRRWKFLVYTTGQMIDIERDVTMSGIERQQKAYELQKFLELIVEQELS
jgi:hypothetical protein